ncbi:MAG: ABC transporter ATP-binding protein [Halanaerobiales bacterium]|nr:ABC transporter ATP-binding protein [Halanaerobiales bacterium]
MKNSLEIKDLNISLVGNKNPLVQNLSFDVRKGKILGIVGESGSGKTLTCKAIIKLLNEKVFKVSGSIKLDGNNILTMSEKQSRAVIGKDISMIMQNPMTAFNPMMKIGQHIVETIKAHTELTKKQAYALGSSALEEMNLQRVAEIMNSYPHTLSGGMLQRVMIAIALMLEPSIIIADEATTALDVKNQAIILEQFQRMRDIGIGLLVVTHDFGVIAQVADDVLVMKAGEIIEQGSVYQIFYNPKTEYTKELLQSRFLVDEEQLCLV